MFEVIGVKAPSVGHSAEGGPSRSKVMEEPETMPPVSGILEEVKSK